MGSVRQSPSVWKSVPTHRQDTWRMIFGRSTSGLDLVEPCPVCGATRLHRWFDRHKTDVSNALGPNWAGWGSEWQWCSQCRSYEHSSGLVPRWWQPNVALDSAQFRHDPGPIDDALERWRAAKSY